MEDSNTYDQFENQQMPNNNMTLAIVSTVLGLCSPCCIGLVLGIIAIVMASGVKKKFESGDVAGAEKAAKNVKILAIVALALVVLNIVYNAIFWESTNAQIQELMQRFAN